MVDSLDTMILMGLHEEFARALPHIERLDFSLPPKVSVSSNSRLTVERYAPFFETVIRYLGGLLSAYALTHEPILLQRADDLATKLDPVFNTTSGLPTFGVNPDTCVFWHTSREIIVSDTRFSQWSLHTSTNRDSGRDRELSSRVRVSRAHDRQDCAL